MPPSAPNTANPTPVALTTMSDGFASELRTEIESNPSEWAMSITPAKDMTPDITSAHENEPEERNPTAAQAPSGARKLSTVASAKGRYIKETAAC